MEATTKYLQIHPADNIMVALQDLSKGSTIKVNGHSFLLHDHVAAKHKFSAEALEAGDSIFMYGVLVGKANNFIPQGSALTIKNVRHATEDYTLGSRKANWLAPDVSKWKDRTFMGFHRPDGSVGTANYWIVIPLVFCENRNVEVLKEALVDKLGYTKVKAFDSDVDELINLYRSGRSAEDLLNAELPETYIDNKKEKVFPNIDGIKFLNHEMGCGGTRMDSDALCGLLAGYITHPNVAGATVLSLGCQNAQVPMLEKEIHKRDPNFSKPLYILEQQKVGMESDLIAQAIRQTFAGLVQANQCKREPAPLSKLCVGLECGGSDGFSGISANPAIGYTSDLLVALGGSVILSEFPELCGVEQELSDRCVNEDTAMRFAQLMKTYNERAIASGSGFDMNPSPGNIKDGLITDAIKSAGAAKKGGTSPVVPVVDYPDAVTKPGLNLLCTPGNDVESTTAEVGAGANIVLFTTGLGTPTGNPITPVVKLSSNTALYNRMRDIIDVNTGSIIEGEETIEEAGARILDYVISVASGETAVSAVRHGQDDFIPWKRGISL